MGREVGGRLRGQGHMYTYDELMLMYCCTSQYCKAIILQLKIKFYKKGRTFSTHFPPLYQALELMTMLAVLMYIQPDS